MSRGRRIYGNVKNKASIIKYEEDCVIDYKNGEDIGQLNHSRHFAQKIIKCLGIVIENQLTAYFKTPLEATGQLPPFSMCTDKMTNKHRTNHLSAFITPDISAPLTDDFLKPVYIGMPVVKKHKGHDIMEQMLEIAEQKCENLSEQLQAFNNDGQYAESGLNIKKHFYLLRPEFNQLKDWVMFNWDPAHINNLGDKDARKQLKDHEKSNFQVALDAVQWAFHHITYGKHYEEYLEFCKENSINPRSPLSFSETQFPQYCYFVLRNFFGGLYSNCSKTGLRKCIKKWKR